jgi:hypothetical protein
MWFNDDGVHFLPFFFFSILSSLLRKSLRSRHGFPLESHAYMNSNIRSSPSPSAPENTVACNGYFEATSHHTHNPFQMVSMNRVGTRQLSMAPM